MRKQKKAGRPSVYTDEMGEEICRRIAEGESLRAICRSPNMPDERRVREWALDAEHPISPRYARAREIQAWHCADELLAIADEATEETVATSRLKLDTRKWWLAKLLPKTFGDKVSTEISGPNGGPVETTLGGVSGLLAAARRIQAEKKAAG